LYCPRFCLVITPGPLFDDDDNDNNNNDDNGNGNFFPFSIVPVKFRSSPLCDVSARLPPMCGFKSEIGDLLGGANDLKISEPPTQMGAPPTRTLLLDQWDFVNVLNTGGP
jgi:hypothetical protein